MTQGQKFDYICSHFKKKFSPFYGRDKRCGQQEDKNILYEASDIRIGKGIPFQSIPYSAAEVKSTDTYILSSDIQNLAPKEHFFPIQK